MEESKLTRLFRKMMVHKYYVVFCLTVLGYILLYSPYGFTEGDDGFITALSWRIYNGQLPYIDFIYVRPPLTLFLHTLPFYLLPHEIVIFSERVLFFMSLAVGSYFGAKSLLVVFAEHLKEMDLYLLSELVFIYSVSSFTPMAWHSIDGVLFGSIGVYMILSGETRIKTGVGLMFLCLAAMTKQSFYPMPLLAIIYILYSTASWKRSFVALALLLFFGSVFYSVMQILGMWTELVNQTTSETTIKDAYTVGVYAYLHSPVIYFVVPLIIFLFLNNFHKWNKSKILMGYTPLILVFFSLTYSTAFYLNRLLFKEMSKHDYLKLEYGDPLPTVLFIAAVMFLTANAMNKRLIAGLGFMLSLSWCAAISWAHHSPHLYSAPWIIIPVIAGVQYFGNRKPERIIIGLIFMGLIVYHLAYLKPFNSGSRSEMKYDLENAVPELRHIKGDLRIYSQLQELAGLFKLHSNECAVLPAMPLANFFFDQHFPLPIDWPINCESAGKQNQIFDSVVQNCKFVFINREWLNAEFRLNDYNRRFSSAMTIRISKEWSPVDSTASYIIFKNPKR